MPACTGQSWAILGLSLSFVMLLTLPKPFKNFTCNRLLIVRGNNILKLFQDLFKLYGSMGDYLEGNKISHNINYVKYH